jgi:nickel-dependent lactate racemase
VLVELAYGRHGLLVELPEGTSVLRPNHPLPQAPPELLVDRALSSPIGTPRLRELVRPGDRVAIALCDHTRPQPRAAVLEAILGELEGIVDDADIVVLIAGGTHRASSAAEIEAMLSPGLVSRLEVVCHDASDRKGLVDLGPVGDLDEVLVNRRFLEADVRITTGVVEPHFFAGFSGGPKLVAPGLAGIETTLALHDARRIGDARATFGVTKGNPVHDALRAIAEQARVSFACEVVLDAAQRPAACFAGELFAAHEAACALVRKSSMVAVEEPFDIVVTTNAGHPLDQNLYQAVKGMAAAAKVVRPGGLIVLVARCEDGFPDNSNYRRLVTGAASPARLLEDIAHSEHVLPDQWQAQVQARVQCVARVALYTEGIDATDVVAAHLEPIADVAATVAAEAASRGPRARVGVLPEGPRTIPYLRSERSKAN